MPVWTFYTKKRVFLFEDVIKNEKRPFQEELRLNVRKNLHLLNFILDRKTGKKFVIVSKTINPKKRGNRRDKRKNT